MGELFFLYLIWQAIPAQGVGHAPPPSKPNVALVIVLGAAMAAPFWRVWWGMGTRLGERIFGKRT